MTSIRLSKMLSRNSPSAKQCSHWETSWGRSPKSCVCALMFSRSSAPKLIGQTISIWIKLQDAMRGQLSDSRPTLSIPLTLWSVRILPIRSVNSMNSMSCSSWSRLRGLPERKKNHRRHPSRRPRNRQQRPVRLQLLRANRVLSNLGQPLVQVSHLPTRLG